MSSQTIAISGDDSTAVITLSRPHCLDIAGKHEILEAVKLQSGRTALRAVVLSAADPQAWLVNVAELAEMSPDEARAFSRAGHQLADALAQLPVPVIAAVDGPALGGGCELVLACDFAFGGPNARFGQIESLGGVLPAFGGTWSLPGASDFNGRCVCSARPKFWMPMPRNQRGSSWTLCHRKS